MKPQHRRRSASPRRRMLVGATALLLVAAATYAVFIREYPWSTHWTLRAVLANSAQITPGSPVRIAGLQVGQVASVTQGPGTTALLTMDIDPSGRPIHRDATLLIRPRLFLEGSYYVDLHPGSPTGPVLSSGSTLPLPQTQVPVSFGTVLSTLTSPIRSSLIDIIDTSASSLGQGGARGLNGGIRALGPALRSGAIAAEALVGTAPDDVRRLIEGSNQITQVLAQTAPELAGAISREANIAATLATHDQQLTASVRGFATTLHAAPPALTALTASLPTLQSFADDLDPALRVAPQALTRTDALLEQVEALVAQPELPRLISILGPLSRQVTKLAPKLESLFPRVQAVASCAANQLVPLLDAKLNDGKLSTGQTVWQELAHVNVGLASANQDFDAAGTSVRFATNLQPNLLAVGSVPGVGALLENTEKPLLGIRPEWTGTTPPPLHPEVPCDTQPLGSLQAAGVPMPSTATARVSLNLPDLTNRLRNLISRADRSSRQ